MRRQIIIEPDGWPCTLADCPPGLFEVKGQICFKSEYRDKDGHIESFNSAGEYFWGGVKTHAERAQLMVQPVRALEVE